MGTGKTYSTKYLLDSNNSSGVAGQVLSTTSTGIDWADVNTLPGAGLWLESGNNIYNSNSGNVAIGVTTTGAKLQIDKANANSSVIISRSGTNIGASTGVGSITFPSHYNSSYTDYAAIQAYSNNLSSVRGSLDLKVKSTSGNLLTGMTVYGTSSGVNVGIGTTSPGAKLDVIGDVETSTRYLITTGTANETAAIGYWDGVNFRVESGAAKPMLITSYQGNIKLGTSGGTTMTVQSSNVGIGTTSPNNILELSKQVSSGIGPILQLTNSQYADANDSGSSIQFRGYTVWGPGSTNPRYSEINAINGSGSVPKRIEFKFYADTNVKTPLSILQTGRVGVGTTTPGNVFVVESAVSASAAEFINTNPDANPSGIVLKKLSTSPADNDVLGRIIFQGNNDAATPGLRTFGRIETIATDVTDGEEDGDIYFYTTNEGTQSAKLRITDTGAVQSRTSGNIILNYRSGNSYTYVAPTLYNNWNKIGTFTNPNNSARIFTEILAKGDNNYPIWMKGTVIVSFYSTGVSVSCQTDGGYEGGHNFQCIVTKDGTTYDVWLRVPDIEWSSFVQYRTLNNTGFTENYVFTTASGNVSNSAPTGQDDETDAIEPNSSYRFVNSDLKTPTHQYKCQKFLINGSETVKFQNDLNYFTQKVGIGTTSPDSLLNLEGSRNNAILTIGNSTNDSNWTTGDKLGAINFYSADNSGAGSGVKASLSYEVAAGTSSATNAMVFRTAGTTSGTNNTERMRIFSNGNVNIGVAETGSSAVTGPFVVTHGSSRFLTSSFEESTVSLSAKNNSNNLESLRLAGDSIKFFNGTNTVGSQKMVILSSGNVGIGTTNPTETLTVPSVKGVMLGFKKFYSNTGTVPAGIGPSYPLTITLNEEQGTTMATQHQYKVYNTTTGTGTYNSSVYIVYRNSSDNAWVAREVTRSGTTSNQPELTVSGNNIQLYNDHPSAYGVSYRVETTYTGQAKTSPDIFGSDYMWQRTGGVLSYTDGNVGIGPSTTSPLHRLEVRDGTISGEIAKFSAIGATVVIESSTAGNAKLFLKPNTTGSKRGEFRVTDANDYGFLWTADTSTNGTAYMELEASSTGGGDLTVKGDVIAYGSPSDKKYKENIKPIESALDKAMKLQGVTFDWKDNDSILDIKEDIGFIAQDVQEVLPELVRENKKGNLSLRYQGITPILLEAIKELKAEIEELKKQIK